MNGFLEFQFSSDNGGQFGCPKKSDKFPLLKFFSKSFHLHSTLDGKSQSFSLHFGISVEMEKNIQTSFLDPHEVMCSRKQ